MSAQRYDFEGEPRTVAQVHAIMRVCSESAIREYLRAGARTRADILARADQGTRNQRAAAKRGGQATRKKWGML